MTDQTSHPFKSPYPEEAGSLNVSLLGSCATAKICHFDETERKLLE